MKKNTYMILGLVYLSFIALGLSEGALGVAWPSMRYDMDLPLAQAGIIMVIHAIFYSLSSSQLGRLARSLKLEQVDLLGLCLMAMGAFCFIIAPDFNIIILAVAITGCGMGLIDSSLNSYMAKNFTSRYMNWMHCFWGLGATASPIIMARMIMMADWRMGYVVLASIHLSVASIILVSLRKKIWQREESLRQDSLIQKGGNLSKKSHQFLMIFLFFLYVGAEHSIGFWITSVMLESRHLSHEQAAMFPATYYAMIMAGRLVFGFLSNHIKDMSSIRLGFAMSIVGLSILMISNSIIGIALVGFGFAPIFPCFVNETANRFKPEVLTKLVGYEIAAVGAGIAIISAGMGQALSIISMEVLFPATIALVIIALLFNEISSKTQKTA